MRKAIAGVVLAAMAIAPAWAEMKPDAVRDKIAAFYNSAEVMGKLQAETQAQLKVIEADGGESASAPEGWEPPVVDWPHLRPQREVEAEMRAEGRSEACIGFYRKWRSCERFHGTSGSDAYGICYDRYAADEACAKKDVAKLAEALAKIKLRHEGVAIVDLTGGNGAYNAYLGHMQAGFNPVIPPPDVLEGVTSWLRLQLGTEQVGALGSVWIKPVEEHVFDYTNIIRESKFYSFPLEESIIERAKSVAGAATEAKGAFVVECHYQQGDGTVKTSAFWLGERPSINRDSLVLIESTGIIKMPSGEIKASVTPIGGAKTQCPDQW